MTHFSIGHHTFDIALATEYGLEESVLIHHFQYWTRFNKRMNRNFRDGRTWTYQTRKEIAANFPYLNYEKVKYACEKLVACGVLVVGNFNKSPIDKTLWYAFADEKKFGVDDENLKNVYERENSPSIGKIPQPIPDTITQISPNISKVYKKGSQQAAPVSAEADTLSKYLLDNLRKMRPAFKEPNLQQWARTFDLMLRVDKRTVAEIKEAIDWRSRIDWISENVLSPQSLRNKFDEIMIKARAIEPKSRIKENLQAVWAVKQKYPTLFKTLVINPKSVTNIENGKDLSLDLPKETFEQAFMNLFGLKYV